MSPTSRPGPWDQAPTGEKSPFIPQELLSTLVVDQTCVEILWIHDEQTQHGVKIFVDIVIPGTGDQYTIAVRRGNPRNPRTMLLRHLATYMDEYPDTPVYARVVSAGSGVSFAPPQTAPE